MCICVRSHSLQRSVKLNPRVRLLAPDFQLFLWYQRDPRGCSSFIYTPLLWTWKPRSRARYYQNTQTAHQQQQQLILDCCKTQNNKDCRCKIDVTNRSQIVFGQCTHRMIFHHPPTYLSLNICPLVATVALPATPNRAVCFHQQSWMQSYSVPCNTAQILFFEKPELEKTKLQLTIIFITG